MTKENTKVQLDIRPQVKGPLPVVKLKPSEAQTDTAELVTNLILQKYNTLQKQFTEIKNKFLSLPIIKKISGLLKSALDAKNKYLNQLSKLNKDMLTVRLPQIKNKVQSLNQTKSILNSFNKKLNLTGKLDNLKKRFSTNVLQAKINQVKEDLQEIQEQSKNILQATLQHQINKDSKPTA